MSPVAPRRPCRQPGCGVLTHNSYCEKHEKKKVEEKKQEVKRYDNARGTANSRGYTYRWQKYAKQFLKDHPLCAICEKKGILELAECVDHIIAVDGPDDPLFWDTNNHQSLSKKCHSVKTDLEDGAFGRNKIKR